MAGKEFDLGPTGRTVAENIRRLRGSTSYAELSRWLADRKRFIPPLGLRRIEAGERRVDVDELLALALIFDVNPNALLFPPADDETEYEPTGAGRGQSLERVWDWADGRRPFWRDDEHGITSFVLHARPPGRQFPGTDTDLTVEHLQELARTLENMTKQLGKRSDGDD
ncbi:helix-turn-helix domain-containing protein [uncultured Arthrobacter sp.]|uniref:helix-turn-helix domain-containing protein n=1 Tax=uncultured Arthrobacter sp. TaxID=114050 RepID=UPI0026124C6E|nr:hypothetical protein [uncultured Arthrobacter sp.]